MLTFKQFLDEMAVVNKISKTSSVPEVRKNMTYWPDTYKSDAKHMSNLKDLELHKSESNNRGTYFTWHPQTRQIHHVLTYTRKGDNLEDITGNGRPKSSVKYADLLHHLATKHGENIITRSSSPGAAKAWESLRKRPGVKVQKMSPMAKFKDLEDHEPTYGEKDVPIRLTKA